MPTSGSYQISQIAIGWDGVMSLLTLVLGKSG